MKIVVGLGNPGSKYTGTRHNIGFEVADYLARTPAAGPWRAQFQSKVLELSEAGTKVLLVKPETFMNLSGKAVRQIVDFYKLTTDELMIVSDDFNLPLGKLRVRAKGSHGGQNGLRNIQEQLGTDAYPRLRIGVGQPDAGEAVDFVLSKFKPGERHAVEAAVADAADAVLIWIRAGLEPCMNRYNAGEAKPKPKPKPAGEPKAKPKPAKGEPTTEPPTDSPTD